MSEEFKAPLTDIDTKTKPGFVILTFADGSTKEYSVDDPEFLNGHFELVPETLDS